MSKVYVCLGKHKQQEESLQSNLLTTIRGRILSRKVSFQIIEIP